MCSETLQALGMELCAQSMKSSMIFKLVVRRHSSTIA